MSKIELPITLDGSLILRQATPEDAAAIADFNAHVHNDKAFDADPFEWIRAWTLDLMNGKHPHVKADDFTVVYDGDRVVSTMMLIPQTWTFDGIPFGVGRIELVGTHPDYRKRGLIRRQFEVIHQWCEARNLPVQSITGIPWYYRMFGYEMGMELSGGRIAYPTNMPELKKDEQETYSFRPATQDDVPFIDQVMAVARQRTPIAGLPDRTYLNYGFEERSPQWGWHYVIIEDLQGKPQGYLSHAVDIWGKTFVVFEYELLDSASWVMSFPAMLRWSRAEAQRKAEADSKNENNEVSSIVFELSSGHPCYTLMPEYLPRERKPYGWYMRVPDLVAFLAHVRPALETRLAASNLRGYSGDLRLSFYHSGIKLVFKDGTITSIEAWQPDRSEGEVRFPDLTFLQMLFAFRSFEELDAAYPDCYAAKEIPALLNALFPKRPVFIRAVQ